MNFIQLDASAPKFFGFSEYISGLALMALIWTIGDERYRFRVRTTSIALQGITFTVTGAVGVLTLLTDWWRAEQWLVPKGILISPAGWQASLAAAFLITFFTWIWFAVIRPPIFTNRNARKFHQTLCRLILKGSSDELAVIADELIYSVKPLIRWAVDRERATKYTPLPDGTLKEEREQPSEVSVYANQILLLIADKTFCRTVVESSPGLALSLFHEISETKKYGVPIGTFGRNIVNAALANKDS
jgi:hypothetical protein